MKLNSTISPHIIDRRRHVAGGVLAGVLATIIGFFAVRSASTSGPDHDLVGVVSTSLDRGQAYWSTKFPAYRFAKVVLFERSTSSACGRALATSGPIYCERDERIYLDLSFLRAIDGDLGRAYVIGHELGHHVQRLRGQLGSERESVDVELGADCLAGEWIRDEQNRGNLEGGDLSEALRSAAAVGDDRICPSCSPELWSHGSSSQRHGAVTNGFAGLACF